MKKRRVVIVLVCVVMVTSLAIYVIGKARPKLDIQIRKEVAGNKTADLRSKGIRVGEKFVFAGRCWLMGVVPVGFRTTLEVKEMKDYHGRRVYHLVAEAKPSPFIFLFCKASAIAESYMDSEKLYPYLFKQHFEVPMRPLDHYDKEIIFDQENLVMEIPRERKRTKILPNTQDPISTLFYIRTQEFEMGKTFTININTNQKNYEIRASVVGKDSIRTSRGQLAVWVVEVKVRRRDASMIHSSDFTIWITDDALKLPVLMKADTEVGPVVVHLVRAIL